MQVERVVHPRRIAEDKADGLTDADRDRGGLGIILSINAPAIGLHCAAEDKRYLAYWRAVVGDHRQMNIEPVDLP